MTHKYIHKYIYKYIHNKYHNNYHNYNIKNERKSAGLRTIMIGLHTASSSF